MLTLTCSEVAKIWVSVDAACVTAAATSTAGGRLGIGGGNGMGEATIPGGSGGGAGGGGDPSGNTWLAPKPNMVLKRD